MIALLDYGSGNIKAIANIYGRLGVPHFVAAKSEDLDRATRIILPGVGAFDQTVQHLHDSGLREALARRVLEDKLPFLGICVGMQLLAARSDEGRLPGLGWIDGAVRKFDHARFTQRTHLPHMGWNDAIVTRSHPLFAGLEPQASFYFLHSYYFEATAPGDVLAVADYGGRFTCAVHRDNIHGVQFHPEKSHADGIRLLQNFAAL
jgi:glutamine amidotransferase